MTHKMCGLYYQLLFFCLALDVCVASISVADVVGPVTEVRPLQGRPTFYVNDRPYTRPLFATYVPTEYYYSQMAGIGTEVFNFQTNCSACNIGFSTPTWKAENEWDFSQMDERAHLILAAKPDAWILPRIYIGTPKWYRDKYPEEMIILDHGGTTYIEPYNKVFDMQRPYASIASEKWRRDMGGALRKTVEHMLQSDYGEHIFGFEIAALGSEEWYYLNVNQLQLGDYSIHAQKAFQTWLRKKYKTAEELSEAWRKPHLAFEDVTIPLKEDRLGTQPATFRNPQTDMHVIDFYLFYNDLIPETIDYFAGIVKQTTNDTKVVGAFYDYMYEFRGNPEFGHNGGAAIMRSDNIDFICAPPSYYERQLGSGSECYRRPFLPGTLHNKIWFHDNDLASFRFFEVMKRHNLSEETLKHYASQISPTPTVQESVWLYQRAAGFVLCEGIYQSFFDLHGGYFDHPRFLHELEQIGSMLAGAVDYDRSSIAEILILADEASLSYGAFTSDYPPKAHKNRINLSLLEHQPGFIKAGAPFDSGLLSDLDLIDFAPYKLVVFLNTWHIGKEDRERIREKIQKTGTVVVWCYAPGYFKGNSRSAAYMKDLTGITIVPTEDPTLIEPKVELTEAGREWMQQYKEELAGFTFGMEGDICRLFQVDDDDATVLGYLKGCQVPTMAIKEMDGWTSIYSLSPVFPTSVVRTLARQAGVHIFSETNDTFYANRSYITINAASQGDKTVNLPFACDVYDAIDNALIYRNVGKFSEPLMEGETRIYRYECKP